MKTPARLIGGLALLILSWVFPENQINSELLLAVAGLCLFVLLIE